MRVPHRPKSVLVSAPLATPPKRQSRDGGDVT